MATKLEENAKLREMIDTLETTKDDLQTAKNNIADVLGLPFTGSDKLETTKNTLSSIRSTFVSNLNRKGVPISSSASFKTLVENVESIEQGNMDIPLWFKPKNYSIEGIAISGLTNESNCVAIDTDIFFLCYNRNIYFRKYNTLTNTYSSVVAPSTRKLPLLTYYKGYIYCIGGYSDTTAISSCQKYNVSTNSWTYISNMITARGATCGNTYAYSDEIHVLYGSVKTTDTMASAVDEYYKANTNTWSTKATLQASTKRRMECAKDYYNLYIAGLSDPDRIYNMIIVNYSPDYGTMSEIAGHCNSFMVGIKNMMYIADRDYHGSGTYATHGYNKNGEVFKHLYENSAVPTGNNIYAVSIKDKYIYYYGGQQVKCYIPEL
ncbi:kelch repeat-containing protein [Clostridioides difficile]|nr:kelch repeat-containing protein [Clostridioides difficile]VHU61307.1 Ig domain-containing protein [Clostridioides difficile]HBG2115449.1 kelch repeat-containing protein [Clostridioides difficile]HBG2166045.1 kelch repeat-containing protein [Clostridioides difficile]